MNNEELTAIAWQNAYRMAEEIMDLIRADSSVKKNTQRIADYLMGEDR